MPRGKAAADLTTLQMALVGYKYEREKIDEKIQQIEAQLRGKRAPMAGSGGEIGRTKPVRRELSAAARKRIAAAQRKRWAEHRKMKAAQAKA
jgi:hypothetical protein